MESRYSNELIKAIWRLIHHRNLNSTDGSPVVVRSLGEYDAASDKFIAAEIECGATVYHGDIVMGVNDKESDPHKHSGTILQVVLRPSPMILRSDGQPVLQAVLPLDPVVVASYEILREGASKYQCAQHIAAMEVHERVAMFTRLLAERMARKCRDLKEIYDEYDQNWNETMYIMLMRTMGDSKNKEAFTELARRVRYTAISRERNSIVYVEAMMLGASGLLEMYEDDSYIRELKTTFDYLRQKYSIIPMNAGVWVISHTNPNNHPVIRIAQMATFLSTREFLFDNLVKCRTVEDIHHMFRAEASQYWSTHISRRAHHTNSPNASAISKPRCSVSTSLSL